MALHGLKGARVAGGGGPIRVEFSKGEKESGFSVSKDHSHLSDERHAFERKGGYKRRSTSPAIPSDKSKRQRAAEPSEVLWIGFPTNLNVDEHALRRAFSPFGEIVKITAFPGRTYAFVQFRTIAAAFQAKEALQGKLFNNPKVSICFARSEAPSTEAKRGLLDTPYSPKINSRFERQLGEHDIGPYKRDVDFSSSPRALSTASPFYRSNIAREARGDSLQSRSVESSLNGDFEHALMQRLGRERLFPDEILEDQRFSPPGWNAPPQENPFTKRQRLRASEEPWIEESSIHSLYKKPKTDISPDRELPEYPFSEFGQGRNITSVGKLSSRFPDGSILDSGSYKVNLASTQTSVYSRKLGHLPVESHESWGQPENTHTGPGSEKLQHTSFGFCPSVPKEEWKWEGTIAKGGAPVCRARCFPVGKVLDFMLPEVLNCSARTSLEMLAKHYYQAAGSWVVFFVPETDDDITLYNDFMNYLGEKHRAAVAKLGAKISLFLVPPSEFSERVLKVPGKVSISGVILRFEHPNSNLGSLDANLEPSDSTLDERNYHGNSVLDRISSHNLRMTMHSTSSKYFASSSQNYASQKSNATLPSEVNGNSMFMESVKQQERLPDTYGYSRQENFEQHDPLPSSRWSGDVQIPSSKALKLPSYSASPGLALQGKGEDIPFLKQRADYGTTHFGNITDERSPGIPLPPMAHLSRPEPHQSLPSTQGPSLQSEQLAQLTALLAHQKNLGKDLVSPMNSLSNQTSSLQPIRHMHLQHNEGLTSHALYTGTQVATPAPEPSHTVAPSHLYVPSDISSLPMYNLVASAYASNPSGSYNSQLHQSQLVQQHSVNSSASQAMISTGQATKQQASDSIQEESEEDTQKRLQATLQLAAALLHQIQQQTKNSDQR